MKAPELLVPGIPGIKCEIDGEGSRRGIDCWEFPIIGMVFVCYQHAVILLAVYHGWRPKQYMPREGQ